ncbi:rhodanese-like domain-containing protein [Turicibacter sp. H121]|uniref:rhodanese-like domain-containing protein n=2 Tax=Turicibacteraceae TaxID=2810281 RepID=UPI001F179F49|nr:rhodanese-like domain-containing protein [Turicibacter sp. H121]
MILAILEHEAIQPVMSGAVSEFPSIQYISQKEAQQLIAKTKGIVIIDVRNNTEYIQSHLENAVNIPMRELNEHLPELEKYKDKPIVIYCDKGYRSKTVAIQLEALGFRRLYVIEDGIG